MKNTDSENTKRPGFWAALIMFILLVLIDIVVIGVSIADFIDLDIESNTALIIGIILSVVYALVVFLSRLRKNSTIKWFGWLAIANVLWWGYLLIAG